MTDWRAFAGLSAIVVLLLLVLTRATQRMLSTDLEADHPTGDDADTSTAPAGASSPGGSSPGEEPTASSAPASSPRTEAEPVSVDVDADGDPGATAGEMDGPGVSADETDETVVRLSAFGPWSLLANVLVTHGLFAGLVAAGAVFWQIPGDALGVGSPTSGAVGWGVAAGVALYVANEVGAAGAELLGIDHEERLRELLAPESGVGWVVLLLGVLPMVAVAEELVFRGALVGAVAVGFGISPWPLAVVSSAAFGLAHGAQGRGGVLVTGLLGFALAAAFVLSGSLLVVVLAHYVVNALEFVVHEGLGVEWV